jgi:hypothetical protein
VTTPCATCRHDVLHLVALTRAIDTLRIGARTHHGLRLELIRNVKARRAAKQRYADHLAEHRAAIRDLAAHLMDHAEGRAA